LWGARGLRFARPLGAAPASPRRRCPCWKSNIYTKSIRTATVALKDVSFSVADGEFLVVIGLSGSGKSTLLRCINRLIEPSQGKILLDGVDVTAASGAELRRQRRKIGMVFQQFNLVKRSSVLTNVLAGRLGYAGTASSLLGFWSAADRARAMRALERVGIAGKANSRADALSGGQQQRVGIARALMQEPKLILADEPVASLDPVLSHSILQYLEQLNRDDHLTVICSPALPRSGPPLRHPGDRPQGRRSGVHRAAAGN
jgi:phosphonate transport system ATP-binding protein